jgi:dipeptidase E
MNLGFKPEELDLRNYFEKSKELAKKLSEFGLFWVIGGNTFLLRRAFAQSSIDNWLITALNAPLWSYTLFISATHVAKIY